MKCVNCFLINNNIQPKNGGEGRNEHYRFVDFYLISLFILERKQLALLYSRTVVNFHSLFFAAENVTLNV